MRLSKFIQIVQNIHITYIRQIDNNDLLFHFIPLTSKEKAQPIHYCSVTKTMTKWPTNKYLGFGNSLNAQPLQKVIAGQKLFEDIVQDSTQAKDELVRSLMDLLRRPEKHWPDDELYRRAPHWSESLSSICVRIPDADYGTRFVFIIIDTIFTRKFIVMWLFYYVVELEPLFWWTQTTRLTFTRKQWNQMIQMVNGFELIYVESFDVCGCEMRLISHQGLHYLLL